MSTHGNPSSDLWQCEACGAWLDPSHAVPGSWRWTGTAWEHGGHSDALQAAQRRAFDAWTAAQKALDDARDARDRAGQ